MGAREDWTTIAARGRALRASGNFYIAGTSAFGSDYNGAGGYILLPEVDGILDAIAAFRVAYENLLGAAVLAAIDRHALRHSTNKTGGIPGVIFGVTNTLWAVEEITHLLANHQADLISATDRAFLHLRRSIVADPDIHAKWQTAFDKRETACEKLGAAHLLLHGVYAFKSNAAGEQTDLIVGDKLAVDDTLRGAVRGLVLTEWKLARKGEDADAEFAAARRQALAYSTGSLTGFELADLRYAVVVTDKQVNVPADIDENGVRWRHVNIAVGPLTPSAAARAQ